MQASRWSDVLTLNELARRQLVRAGLVERDGIEVRAQTIGVGDQVMVLRNAPALGVMGHRRLETTRGYTRPSQADRERAISSLPTDR